MKRLALAALLILSSCGTTRDQRLKLYELAAITAGHPEIAATIAGGRRILHQDKQPARIQP